MLLVLSGPSVALAQTRFAEPSRSVDVTQYRYADECLAAMNRLLRDGNPKSTINYDTVPPGLTKKSEPWPPGLSTEMQRCSAKWTGATAPVDLIEWLFPVLLAADREQEARHLMDRGLAEADKADTTGARRFQILKIAAKAYTSAMPVRLLQVDTIGRLMDTLEVSNKGPEKYFMYVGNRDQATEMGQREIAMRLAIRAETAWVKMHPSVKNTGFLSQALRDAERLNNAFVHHQERMDSLAKSTEAYVRLVKKQFDPMESGLTPKGTGLVGNKLPKIAGYAWSSSGTSDPRPTEGRTAMVWPVADVCAMGSYVSSRCERIFGILRRVAKNYPQVEIDFITYAEGFFGERVPPKTDEEGALKKHWLVDQRSVRGDVFLFPGKVVPLPSPDNRKVDIFWEQDILDAYSDGLFSGGRFNSDGADWIVLLDASGIPIFRFEGGITSEIMLNDMLIALAKQPTKR